METSLKACFVIWTLSVMLLVSQVYSAVQKREVTINHGRVVAVGVEVTPTELNWGTVEPNKTYTKSFQVKNIGNAPITLVVDIRDFVPPEFALHSVISHDYKGFVIPTNFTYTINLSLTVSPDVPLNITDFSFNVYVYGMGP